jgi:hypothetical protein
MAIEPFRQRIGIVSPGSLISANAPQVSDPGAAIRSIGRTIMETAEPMLQRRAVEEGQKAAGGAEIKRDAQGNPVKIERPQGGGVLFNQAFDKVAQARYVNQVSYDFQNFLNTEINDRRTGKDGKAFDPDQFDAVVQGRLEGMLKTVDPELKPAVEDVVFREALERTRSFRDEWGRTQRAQAIAGSKDQIEVLLNGYSRYREEGLDAAQAYEKYGAPLDQMVQRMEELGQIGGEEADALLMRVDNLVDSAESYAVSMQAASKFIPTIGGLNATDIEVLANWLRGAPDPRQLDGVTVEGSGEERVTPETLTASLKEIVPSAVQTSGARAESHPLSIKNPESYHSVKNGGRAIDVAPIKGMTFQEYVGRWRQAGYEVVEAIEEVGDKRSPHATGDHWHIALGNRRKVTTTKDNPNVRGLTFEDVDRLDPSVKRSLLAVVTNREQALREEQAIARAEAAEAERVAREQANNQKIVDSINGALANGMGDNFNAEQKGVLEIAFNQAVDLSRMSDPQQQAAALRFIQTNQYVPGNIINYMANTVRSDNWRSAVQLYRNIKGANVGGATVGDVLVDGLDARSKALLTTADDLIASGQPDSVVAARIEQLRSGNGFTRDEAVGEFTRIVGRGREGTYRQERDDQIREVYGIPKGAAIPPALARRIDDSYAANLDVQNRDPEKALQRALQQNKNVYQKSNVFFDGVGPSSLLRAYNQKQLADFFGNATTNGKKLAPPVKGPDGTMRNHSVGQNGTIRLVPLDNNLGSIGRYEVRLFNPHNPSQLMDTFQIDLGKELNSWSSMKPKPAAPRNATPGEDPVAAARAKRAESAANFQRVRERTRTISGPKI